MKNTNRKIEPITKTNNKPHNYWGKHSDVCIIDEFILSDNGEFDKVFTETLNKDCTKSNTI